MKPKPFSLPNFKKLTKQCAAWNETCPVGTVVHFHPVIGAPKFRVSHTTGKAFILSGHTACVFLEGIPGCVALDACEPQ